MDFLTLLFDTSDFPARWQCGNWTASHGWLHILSDLGVWAAYFTIPCILGYFIVRRKDLPFRGIFLLFGAFILACGMTHLMEAILFWWPTYRLAGGIKLVTAIVSWITVVALVPVVPKVLAMRSPDELEREIAGRKKAERELQRANDELEKHIQQRTAELVQANATLQHEREWFRTTLASIGDAVIVTDERGQVTFLNYVAESLTGWQMDEAQGRPLEEVFHIVNEESRQVVESPVVKALRMGVVVGLANHTLLIAKDGTERPIEDSAASIHNEQRDVLGVVLVFRDSSEQRDLDRRRAARLAVTQTLAQAVRVEEAIPKILQDVCTSLEWDVGVFWAVAPAQNVLRCREIWHSPTAGASKFEAASRTLVLQSGDSLPGRVWRTCGSEWVADIRQDPNFARAEAALQEGLRGGFACPVFLDSTVLGVVEFFSREIREPDAEPSELQQLLAAVDPTS